MSSSENAIKKMSRDSLTPKLGYNNLRRYAFVLKFDKQIESHMQELIEKTFGPNEFIVFQKFEGEHPEYIKTIFATTSANHFIAGITLRQNRSTNPIPSISEIRTRSERPPRQSRKNTRKCYATINLTNILDF